MDPVKVAAQFAAYSWFKNQDPGRPKTEEDAVRYADEHWLAFVPGARARLGNTLLQLAEHVNAARRRRRPDVTPRLDRIFGRNR